MDGLINRAGNFDKMLLPYHLDDLCDPCLFAAFCENVKTKTMLPDIIKDRDEAFEVNNATIWRARAIRAYFKCLKIGDR